MQGYSEQDKYWIWLGSVAEVTPKLFYYIMKEYGDAECFFDAVDKGSKSLDMIPDKALAALKAVCSRAHMAELVCALLEKGVRAVTRLNDEYPAALALIPYPPPVLYVKGSLRETPHTLSIVGTRRCTRKGFDLAWNIAKELGNCGMTVVSGMARGIDTAAHSGAIEAGAKTIAVLGCGADVIYPPESEEIYYKAIENGAVVSELVPGAEPLAANFPARNRIIAGLSRGMLVVESELKGGTAISAGMAAAFNRDVFAVPGPPYLAMAALSNMLIKEGAKPVRCASDILEFYGFVDKKFTSGRTSAARKEEIQLDFLQRQIYNLLIQGDLSVESITRCIEYPQSEINMTLTMMELDGLIKRLPGGKYGV
ncbi:MAG: DNA-processing protein DprA [Eubacteriales bacterium]|nr:DNA-processing protein DprA [Eubacteriales bacterium]